MAFGNSSIGGGTSRLTDRQCRAAEPREKAYKLADGGGLFLFVAPTGGKSWRLDFRVPGKRIQQQNDDGPGERSRRGTLTIGLYQHAPSSRSNIPTVSLRQARIARDEARGLIARGINPVQAKRLKGLEVKRMAEEEAARVAELREQRRLAREARKTELSVERNTVRVVVDMWLRSTGKGWSLAHRHQTEQSLRDYLYPIMGKRPIAEVTPQEVAALLNDMLDQGKVETARRLQQRLGKIWRWAIFEGFAAVDVVEAGKDRFKEAKKGADRLHPRKNYPCVAVERGDLGEVTKLLRAMRTAPSDPIVTAALWVVALTGVRTGEMRYATWSEFDLDGDEPIWIIPSERMKVKTRGDMRAPDHVVPLSSQVVQILTELREVVIPPIKRGSRRWNFLVK